MPIDAPRRAHSAPPLPSAVPPRDSRDDLAIRAGQAPLPPCRPSTAALLPHGLQAPRAAVLDPCRVTPPQRDVTTPQAADQALQQHLATQVFPRAQRIAVQRLSEGYSGMLPYRATVDGKDYFAKFAPADHAESLRREAGCARVASDLRLTPRFVGCEPTAQGAAVMVTAFFKSRWIEGPVLQRHVDAVLAGERARRNIVMRLGHTLRTLHAQTALAHTVPAALNQYEDTCKGLRSVRDQGKLPAAEAERLLAYTWELHSALAPLAAKAPQTFLHRDAHVSNLRIDARENAQLVDFGSASHGDPAMDLAYFAFMADLAMPQVDALLVAYKHAGGAQEDASFDARVRLRTALFRVARYASFTVWCGHESPQCDAFRRHLQEDFNALAAPQA